MPGEQKEIYYLSARSRELIENSPYLEAFKARGQEVLLLTEPIDEFLVAVVHDYKGKSLRAADRGEVESDKDDGGEAQGSDRAVRAAAGGAEGEAGGRGEGGPADGAAEGERRGARGGRGGDERPHGTPDAAARAGART